MIKEQTALKKINELRDLIIEGNKETSIPHLSGDSKALYDSYWNKLIDKLKEITGVKVDFSYYTMY